MNPQGPQTAWQQPVALLDCGNTTAKKALDWMYEQGIIAPARPRP